VYSVEDLGKEEEALLKKMPVNGYIEERDAYLKEHGLYNAWGEIYSKYVKLAQEGNLEALKRALFYAWYQLAEPGWLSGIKELPDKQTRTVVDLLEKRLGQGVQDRELEYMLPYYMTVCGYYLERFYPLPNIERASSRNSDYARDLADSSEWPLRGQMGAYWG
jgi:hypothetical protein